MITRKQKRLGKALLSAPSKQFCIGLGGCNRRVSCAAYLEALRRALANPDQVFNCSFMDEHTPATGREIVQQWREMLVKRWATPAEGKGNRARRRVEAIKAARQECRWCGEKTGGPQFCSAECQRSYSS